MSHPAGHPHAHGSAPGAGSGHGHGHGAGGQFVPRLIAWEVTRTCPMNCRHCRAAAKHTHYEGEFTTQECFSLLDNVASFAKPIIILTGGEPMTRPDIYDIAEHGVKLGLPVVMAPCGLLLNDATAARIVQAGIRLISISVDGATAATHDAFRAFEGSFAACLAGIGAAKRAGLRFQINTTVSRHNVEELPAILDLAVRLGAQVFNPFLLVPTGRGKELLEQELSPDQYERTLRWLATQQGRKDIPIRVTCAPHYQRIVRQGTAGVSPAESASAQVGSARKPAGGTPAVPGGCIGGKAFAFVSHVGKVQICGFLDVECGDLRREGLDFRKIWETSEVFRRVRDVDSYRGRCGYCEYRKVCGGCRARAHALSGDYLGEEPFCTHEPQSRTEKSGQLQFPAAGNCNCPDFSVDDTDKRILDAIQEDFPVARRPYDVLGERLGLPPDDVFTRVGRLMRERTIRRLGAVFDARRLGYSSTLVAAQVPPERLAEVAARVSAIPGVTHNYRREHSYNLWFTLTAHSEEEVASALDRLRRETGTVQFQSLPALAIYKSRVVFWMGEKPPANSPAGKTRGRMGTGETGTGEMGTLPISRPREMGTVPASPDGQGGTVPLFRGRKRGTVPPQTEKRDSPHPSPLFSDSQKALIRSLQESLPASREPFDAVAAQVGCPVQFALDQITTWLAEGLIKRLGAVLSHRRIDFEANGMAVFAVPDGRVDEIGERLAQEARISHCYRRPKLPDWPYNLFAMVHGRREEEVRRFVQCLASELRLDRFDILFSTQEYKKESMRFFVESNP